MKRVAYIELEAHAEIAKNIIELSNDFADTSVDFYCIENIYNFIGIKQDNIFRTTPESIISTLSKHNYDHIIIGTCNKHFDIYKVLVDKFKTSILVHNLNFSKLSKKQLFINVFKYDRIYRIKLLLKKGLLHSPYIHQKAFRRFSLNENCSSKDNLTYLPTFFNQFNEQNSKPGIIKIVVPGTVSQKRRDYYSFLKKLHSFKDIGIFYEITLLGKAAGKELEVIQSTIPTLPNFISLNYFEEQVPSTLFNEIMNNSDFLYCPIKLKTKCFSATEYYGKTKVSGNIGDAIRFAKPAILPVSYYSNLEFIIKEKDDLQSQFSTIVNQPEKFHKYNKHQVVQALELSL